MFSIQTRSLRRSAGISLGVLSLIILLQLLFQNNPVTQAFSDTAFAQVWVKTDMAIANGSLKASWIWGPAPRATLAEPYKEATNGQRLVQYFDKGRLEINNPAGDRTSQWFTTSGLLCSELVSGRVQTGENQYENRAPANLPVAGDLDSVLGPTYATFNHLVTFTPGQSSIQLKTGFVSQSINRSGQTGTTTKYPQQVRYAAYEAHLGHNIPDVFLNWMNGLTGRGLGWEYVLGLPISEPYWATFKLGGKEQEVLVQLFERRALTFNPLNAADWQVEMGNIGLHYWTWRYNTPLSPLAPIANPYGLDAEELHALELINQYRVANGRPGLSMNPTLTGIARWMSQDMGDKNYFSHTDSLGRDALKRLTAFGYPSNTYRGENLGAGFETANGVVAAWKNSPEHNQNLLNPNYRVIGISRLYHPNSSYKWYWSTEFGSR
jgi:hypothetical protein